MSYKSPPKNNRFKPGQSGNPKGRPVGALSITTKIKEILTEALEQKDGSKMEIAEVLARSIVKRAIAGNDKMSQLIWNQIDGMPKVKADIEYEDKSQIFTDQQVLAVAQRIVSRAKGKLP